MDRLGDNANFSCFDGQLGHRLAMLDQTFDVKFDRLANDALQLSLRPGGSDAAGQVGNIGGPVPRSFFVNEGVIASLELHAVTTSRTFIIPHNTDVFTEYTPQPAPAEELN